MPASLIGSAIVYVLFILLGYLFGENEGFENYGLHFDMWIANIIAGFAYISIGTLVAPKQQRVVMGLLFGLLLVFLIISIIINVVRNDWSNLVNAICTLIGCVFAVWYLIKEGDLK